MAKTKSGALSVKPAADATKIATGRKSQALPRGSKHSVKVRNVDVAAIEHAATVRRAWERLLRIEEMRDVRRLAEAGKAQREIADLLHTTQPRIHRMLKATEGRPVDTKTPEEVILRATVGHADRRTLVETLKSLTYTFGEHAPYPAEGATSGTWDQVRHAYMTGLLSQEEYERVRDAVKPSS